MFATVDKRLLSSFLVGPRNNDKLLVSHLLFVDDTLIFCEQIVINFIIRDAYSCFEAGLGLKIILAKLELVPPVGDVGDVEGLICILGCRVAFLLMKYLSSFGCFM